MGLKTTVGQVALIGGGSYDRPGHIIVDEPGGRFGRGRGKGNLYIVLELSGPPTGRDAISEYLTQSMRRSYRGWKGSVTAGLRQAIREANDLLLEENRTSLPGERRSAGVSCVVLREDDLFIGQMGPAAVYLLGEGQELRFPDSSPWLDGIPPEEMDAARLGERRDVNVDLFHSKVGEGDTVLLADSELARCLASRAWPDILSRTSMVEVLEDLLAAGRGRDLSALVVRMAEEGIQRATVQPAAQPEVSQPSVRADRPRPLTVTEVSGGFVQPEEFGPVATGAETARIETSPAEEARAEAPPAPAKAQQALEQVSAGMAQLRPGERLRSAMMTMVAALTGFGAGLLVFLKRMVPDRSTAQRQPRTEISTSKRAAAKPSERQTIRSAADARSDPVQRLLVGVAIAIPVIVAVIVLVAWVQRGQAQRGELDALWEQANAQWKQAQTVSDLDEARTLLADAQKNLELLIERQPENAEAIDLQGAIQVRLDLLNQVKRVSWAGVLNTYPADSDLSRVVVQGAHVFVMDRNNGKVYHHKLDEQLQNALEPDSAKTVLVSKGDQIGNVLVGDLVDMVWMPTGPNRQKASLVVLESNGALLDYDPATRQLQPLDVAASETWQYPQLVGSHSGRFYLLDSSANKLWRYDPTPDGYSEPPTEWLQTEVNLAGVGDMAIGDSIYLIYADGRILKFSQGAPDAFDISDWDVPPSNPSAIFTRPSEETRWLYVADRGNSRIVQATKEGQFRQQFLLADAQAAESGDALADATDLFVDEIVGYAYVLSGQQLYLLILPMSQ